MGVALSGCGYPNIDVKAGKHLGAVLAAVMDISANEGGPYFLVGAVATCTENESANHGVIHILDGCCSNN